MLCTEHVLVMPCPTPKHHMLLRWQAVAQLGSKDAPSNALEADELARASDAAMASTLGEVARCLTDFERRLQCESVLGSLCQVDKPEHVRIMQASCMACTAS